MVFSSLVCHVQIERSVSIMCLCIVKLVLFCGRNYLGRLVNWETRAGSSALFFFSVVVVVVVKTLLLENE